MRFSPLLIASLFVVGTIAAPVSPTTNSVVAVTVATAVNSVASLPSLVGLGATTVTLTGGTLAASSATFVVAPTTMVVRFCGVPTATSAVVIISSESFETASPSEIESSGVATTTSTSALSTTAVHERRQAVASSVRIDGTTTATTTATLTMSSNVAESIETVVVGISEAVETTIPVSAVISSTHFADTFPLTTTAVPAAPVSVSGEPFYTTDCIEVSSTYVSSAVATTTASLALFSDASGLASASASASGVTVNAQNLGFKSAGFKTLTPGSFAGVIAGFALIIFAF